MPGEFQVAKELRRLGNEAKVRAAMSEFACPVGIDFIDWMVLIGRGYLVQVGTEDAPTDTTPVDDTTAHIVVDIPTGVTVMLAEVSTHIVDFTTGTAAMTLVEMDNGKVRYSSGGTAFTLLNLNNAYSNASGLAAYVGPDITAAAKTAGGSLEVARWQVSNDAKATETADEQRNFLWSAKKNIWVIAEGPASFVVYFGSATADVTGYAQAKVIVL
ncbi:hypothetical protein ACFLXA_02915 [Chloroflexota bacterium]